MAGFFSALSVGAVMIHIVIHATDLGISTANAVIILMVIGGTSIPGRAVMGVTSDRIGNKRALIICFTRAADRLPIHQSPTAIKQ